MTGSVALDVVIGLVFIYLLYSLLASLLQEIIATNLSFRAKILEKGIARMLQDNDKSGTALDSRFKAWMHLLFSKKILKDNSLAEKFYKHPLIKYLGEDKWYNKPSYLEAKNFSKVVVDLLRGPGISIGDDQRMRIENALKNSPLPDSDTDKKELGSAGNIETDTASLLNSLWLDAQGDIERFRELLENWFDATMERATGWYKRYSQVCLFVIGLIIAIVFNVDSIQIVTNLSNDPEARKQLVEYAGNFIKEHPTLQQDLIAQKKRIDELLSEKDTTLNMQLKDRLDSVYSAKIQRINALAEEIDTLIHNDIKKANELLALGWSCQCKPAGTHREHCDYGLNGYTYLGWLLTALALSLGASFWFDILNKVIKLRSAVQAATQEGSVKTGSSDKIKRVG